LPHRVRVVSTLRRRARGNEVFGNWGEIPVCGAALGKSVRLWRACR
jgi:hypothetical protein